MAEHSDSVKKLAKNGDKPNSEKDKDKGKGPAESNLVSSVNEQLSEMKLDDNYDGNKDINRDGDDSKASSKDKGGQSSTKRNIEEYVKKLLEEGDEKDAAVIFNTDNKVLGEGFNTEDKGVLFHASLNAIVNASQDLEGCTLLVRYYPCNECAKLILVSGIKKVVHIKEEKKYEPDAPEEDKVQELFKNEKIKRTMKFSIKRWGDNDSADEYESMDEDEDESDSEQDEVLRDGLDHSIFMDRAKTVGNQTSGACIVHNEGNQNKIFKKRARFPCKHLGSNSEIRHLYVCHAELRVIVAAYKKVRNLNDCNLYVTRHPCIKCGPLIIKSGITVIYESDWYEPFEHFNKFENIQVYKYSNGNITAISGEAGGSPAGTS